MLKKSVCRFVLCSITCMLNSVMLNSSMLKNVQVKPPVQVEPNPSAQKPLQQSFFLVMYSNLKWYYRMKCSEMVATG